ncbi:MAG: hypothetical protein HND55_12050 [Pseudomonadota bacterium]|nr:MAG: hypothetical protein HND55_12050 [Pseudomonadota bacterium]
MRLSPASPLSTGLGPLLAGLVLAMPAAAASEDSVQHWLDRMSRAVETLNYRGTLVHVRQGHVDTLRVIHRADQDGVRERIYSIDGPPREVLRNGNSVRCVLPGDQPLLLESQLSGRLLPSLPVSRLIGPDSAYRMRLGGRQRVAGMMTREIEIEPRDAYRYGSRVWLEEQTGMLLRYAVIDRHGNHLQQFSFTEIELGVPISDAELEPELDGTLHSLAIQSQQARERSVISAAGRMAARPRVPGGYRLIRAGQGQSESSVEFEHLLYSDGLASFSIYIERADDAALSGRIDTVGPIHVYSAQSGGYQFTVVGKVPAATVDFVGRQLRRSGGAGARLRR